LEYQIDATALQTVCDMNLGKTILISNRSEWDDERIIRAYRSQFIIEGVFKETKDRDIGIWWRMHHWTDSKIHVHALYCTIALLLRALMLRRAVKAGLPLSMPRLLSELRGVREVVTIYPRKRSSSTTNQTVLSKTSELQQQLLSLLGISSKNVELG
jgi:transposase